MIHKLALNKLAADEWTGLTVKCMLLHETSVAAPEIDDTYLNVLDPATNELDATGYTRQTVGSKAVSWNGTTHKYELTGGTVTFANLVSGHTGHGISGVVFYVFGTVDADSWLLHSYEVSPAVVLNGDDVIVTFGTITIGNT